MLAKPNNWTIAPTHDGLMLTAPEGPAAAIVKYVERVRPLQRAADVLRERLAVHRNFQRDRTVASARLTTVEGEYAYYSQLEGRLGKQPAQYVLGLTFGDDFYARTEGFCLAPQLFARFAGDVRALVVNDRHVLGARRRRYLYRSNGWRPVARGFLTDWVPPGYPRDSAIVTVYPAVPSAVGAAAVSAVLSQDALARKFVAHQPASPAQVQAGSKLAGGLLQTTGTLGGQEVLFSLVALSDARYLYMAELVSRTKAAFSKHTEDFARLWQSIEPLPEPSAQVAEPEAIWVD